MPRYAQPAGGDWAFDPVAALGNAVKVAIIRYVRAHPGATSPNIIEKLELSRTTVIEHLGELEDTGVLQARPRKSERRRGAVATYAVSDERVLELYIQLGQALGEV